MKTDKKFNLINKIAITTSLFSIITTSLVDQVKASPSSKTVSETPTIYLADKNIATVPNSHCRLVNTEKVPIVNKPNQGQTIGTLSKNQQVMIANEGYNGWVAIESPVSAFIQSKYLTDCSNSASTSNSSSVAVVKNTTSNYNSGENISTVSGSNCRQVNRNKLPVMTRPMGTIVGQLDQNQQVMIANEGYNGWVPIEAPFSGFIQSEYLTDCNNISYSSSSREVVTTVPGSNCRVTLSPNVLVRKTPKGEVIGQLGQNQQVMIANEGYNGWVPIERPTSGYVTSPNLGICMP